MFSERHISDRLFSADRLSAVFFGEVSYLPMSYINPLTAVSAYLHKTEGPSLNNS